MAVDDALVSREVALGNMRRLRWLLPILLALALLLLTVFSLEQASGSPVQQAWQNAMVQLYS
ncbi:MAG: hypothetical protein ABIR55_21475, partial [Burkholderiaceae bacterium]